MKKSLLLASTALLCVGSAFAGVDPASYETVNGHVLKNRFLSSQYLDAAEWQAFPWMATPNYARTACLANVNGEDVVIVAASKVMEEGVVTDRAVLHIVNLATGKLVKSFQPTVNGETINTLLGANQVGCDDAGNVWFASYYANAYAAATETAAAHTVDINIYKVDDFNTGACSLAATVMLPEDEAEANGRIDYYDVVGDITREKSNCVIMCAVSGSQKPYVYGWDFEQGSDEFVGHFDEYVSLDATETYAADQTQWGTAPMVRIVKDEDFSGDLFYVDGFNTVPALYNREMSMLESFASVDAELSPIPNAGTNGVGEFTINEVPFLVYSVNQYVAPQYCGIAISELGDGMSFDGMKAYWDQVPAAGLGETSDGGARYHAVTTKVYTDSNGVEGAYLLTYKGANGLGIYTVAPEEWVDPNGDNGVNDIVADEDLNAPVEYFNLNGVKVGADNLTPGLYITRQGSSVSKKVVK